MSVKTKAIRFFKQFGFRAAMEVFHDELVDFCRRVLEDIKPKDMTRFVKGGEALPIPPEAFANLKGFEDLLEQITSQEIFGLLYEARPDIGDALAEFGDEGLVYVRKFRRFIIDSARAARVLAVEETKEEEVATEPKPVPKKKVTCDDCGKSFEATAEESASLEECPHCGAPA